MSPSIGTKPCENSVLIGAFGVGIAIAASASFIQMSLATKKWKRVGRVDKLWVHPLKGSKGKSVTSAEFQQLGLRAGIFKDRTFCVIKDNHEYVALHAHPRLSQLELVFHEGQLCLQAPGKPLLPIKPSDLLHSPEKEVNIRILDVDAKTIIVSEECNQYVSDFILGLPSGLHLVYHYSSSTPLRPPRPKFLRLWPDTYLSSDAPALSHASSYTLLTGASVRALNEVLEKPVGPEWFRPNVLVATDSGEPFQEDQWTGRVRLGSNVILRFNKPCNRCPSVTVDPSTGEKDPDLEPLRTLRKFRLLDPSTSEADAERRKGIGESPLFAVNFSLDKGGVVEVGQEVFVEVV